MKDIATNPLLSASPLPFGAPVFDQIRKEDYLPAFQEAISRAQSDIQAIKDNPEDPSFANTIEALEHAGEDLDRISGIFFNLTEACTDDEMDRIAEEVSPMLTQHSMSILLDEPLFARIKAVWEQRDNLSLDTEAAKLLEETWKSFARHGANLPPEQRGRFAQLSEELSLATLKFGQNVLAATNAFTLHLTDEADLAGLPGFVREMAASEAKARGEEGWIFTLNQPSYGPFLKFSGRRDLREKMWRAYNSKCIGGENDNTALIRKIVSLRTEKARMLGYPSYAEYALEERMAKHAGTVEAFLDKLMTPSLPAARRDVAEVQAYAREQGWESAPDMDFDSSSDPTNFVQLQTARWHQHTPFNDLVAEVNGQKPPIGCVATAIAIVMKYHGWPRKGSGTLPSYDYSKGGKSFHIEGFPLGHEYDWDKMPDYNGSYGKEEAAQMARLLYDVAVMSKMSFFPGGSSANLINAAKKLTEYFDYDKRLCWYERWNGYSDEEWEHFIIDEINNGRPVLYSGGSDSGVGHAFVIDGYNGRYFSLNYGGGSDSHFYTLTPVE